MWQVKRDLNLVYISIIVMVVLFLSLCQGNVCDNQEALLLKLSKQGEEFVPFVDSIRMENNPKVYNANYECLAFATLKKAPRILKTHYIIYKTSHLDSIGVLAFDNYYELAGIPKNKLMVAAFYNRERASFCLLTYEDKGVSEHQPFIILENKMNIEGCNELDFSSIQFKGKISGRKILEITTTYRYTTACKGKAEMFFEKKKRLSL